METNQKNTSTSEKEVTLPSNVVIDVLELASHEHYCGESYENGSYEAELHSPLSGGKIADCEDCKDILKLRNLLITQGVKREDWDKEPIEFVSEDDDNEEEEESI